MCISHFSLSRVTESPTLGQLGTHFNNFIGDQVFQTSLQEYVKGLPLLPRALSLEWQEASERVDRPLQSTQGMASQVGLSLDMGGYGGSRENQEYRGNLGLCSVGPGPGDVFWFCYQGILGKCYNPHHTHTHTPGFFLGVPTPPTKRPR